MCFRDAVIRTILFYAGFLLIIMLFSEEFARALKWLRARLKRSCRSRIIVYPLLLLLIVVAGLSSSLPGLNSPPASPFPTISPGVSRDSLPAYAPKSPSGGTGFPACADRLAGAEARPTNLFMLYGWAKGPLMTALEIFRLDTLP
jgi:hypothetical protein